MEIVIAVVFVTLGGIIMLINEVLHSIVLQTQDIFSLNVSFLISFRKLLSFFSPLKFIPRYFMLLHATVNEDVL